MTGAVGNVGREVVHALRARGMPVRAVDLSRAAVVALHGAGDAGGDAGIESGVLDYENPGTFRDAVAGCSSVFLVRPTAVEKMESTLLPFVDEALASGVQHIVFLSVLGAATNKQVPHHAVENHLAERSASFTLLRPGFFAQNLGVAYRADIADDGRLFLPAGRGRFAFVDMRDVAELAAQVIAEPDRHRGAAYTCTGPESLSFEDTAVLLTDVLGRRIRYEPATLGNYVRHLHVRGLPLAQIAVQTVLHVGLRSGQLETIDPTLERLLGRAPRTVATYIRENIALWAPLSATRLLARKELVVGSA